MARYIGIKRDRAAKPLPDLKVKELKELAKAKEVKVDSKATKAELIAALEAGNEA